MTESIDDLAARWKKQPDAPTTIALCDALNGSVRTTLVQQVADFANAKLTSNVPVLIAVARMYMSSHKLPEAQSILVAAGKIAPREGLVYRVLGEVLLRRGDADRAEKVFERALQFGSDDAETRMWIERAKVYRPIQAKAGARAVAAEVARTAPATPPKPAEPREPMESFSDAETAIRNSIDFDVAAPKPKTLPPPALPPLSPPPRRAPSAAPPPLAPLEAPDDLTFPAPPRAPAFGPGGLAPEPRQYSVSAETAEAFSPLEAEKLGGQAPRAESPFRAPSAPAGVPDARDVLDALALAGVFEKPGVGDQKINWDRPTDKKRRRGTLPLLVLTMLFAAGGIGGFFYLKSERDKAHLRAETQLTQIETDMRKSQAGLLVPVEQSFSQVFELDSRSDRAALDWLRERALSGLLKGGSEVAFEDSITRAREVKVKEENIAAAQVASFLFQGDTVGAAGLLAKWDGPAGQDPWYQLLAGATLERAGDARAKDRYEQATKLDPQLVIAHIGLIRATAVDGDPAHAMELAREFRTRFPDRLEGQALIALSWARDPARSETIPPEVNETIAKGADLPLGLRAVPHALAALLAADKHDYAKTKEEVQAGLNVIDGPGMASWLGIIALASGDENLARKAALAAVGFSAVYPPARVLAARVALLGDRLDEALKATEELDPTSPDVAVVRAAAAYERVDATALDGALEAVPVEARKLPFLTALTVAEDALMGRTDLDTEALVTLASDDAPWADLVAMDVALDTGNLDAAAQIAETWKGTEERPLRALRMSRLSRYQGKLDDADKFSQLALSGGTVTTRSLAERVFVLVAHDKPLEAGPLLAKYPLVLGTLSGWLSGYARAAAGKEEDARGKTASLEPPPSQAPAPARMVAAAALGAMHDRRRGADYVKELYASWLVNPDTVAAGNVFGLKPPVRPAAKKKK